MMQDSIHYFTKGVGFYILFASTLSFFVPYAYRWIQTYKYSKGHFIAGSLGVGSMLVVTIVVVFATEYVLFFIPIAFTLTGVWVGYNDWFFYKFPPPADGYESARRLIAAPGRNTSIGRFLIQAEDNRPILTSPVAKWGLVGLVVFLTWAFGFTRWADAIAYGDRRVAQERKSAKQETKQAVATAVTSATSAVAVAVDTILTATADAAQTAELANKKAASVAATVATNTASQKRYIARQFNQLNANVDRNRRAILTPQSPIKPAMSGFKLPTDVKFVPMEPKKRGKKVSYESNAEPDPADTIPYYVKSHDELPR